MPEGGAWKAAYRLLRVGARLAAILAALVALGAAVYEHIGAWRDSRVLKQIGRSVDIGGRTLNIHCTGEGSPTVIFVSARTAPGYVWTAAEPAADRRALPSRVRAAIDAMDARGAWIEEGAIGKSNRLVSVFAGGDLVVTLGGKR
jgi:hypothetical protein